MGSLCDRLRVRLWMDAVRWANPFRHPGAGGGAAFSEQRNPAADYLFAGACSAVFIDRAWHRTIYEVLQRLPQAHACGRSRKRRTPDRARFAAARGQIYAVVTLFLVLESVRTLRGFCETRSSHSDCCGGRHLADAGFWNSEDAAYDSKRGRSVAGQECSRLLACVSRWQNGHAFAVPRKSGAAEFLGDVVRAVQSRDAMVCRTVKAIRSAGTASRWRGDGRHQPQGDCRVCAEDGRKLSHRDRERSSRRSIWRYSLPAL